MNATIDGGEQLPRVYKAPAIARYVTMTMAALFMVLGLAGVVIFGRELHNTVGMTVLTVLLSIVLCAVGALILASTLRHRVVLTADSITLREVFGERTLKRSDIRGRRALTPQDGPDAVELVPNDPTGKPLKVARSIRFDEPLKCWLADIPDLDALDEQAMINKVKADPAYGATPDARLHRLAQQRRLIGYLNIAALVAALWAWIYPHPYSLAIATLMLIPVVAVVLVIQSNGQIRWDTTKREKYPAVATSLASPALMLALRAFLDFDLVDWRWAAAIGGIGGLFFLMVFAKSGTTGMTTAGLLVLVGITGVPYSYGAAVELNCLMDHSHQDVYQTRVEDKHHFTGRHTSWTLTLRRWGPVSGPRDVEVSAALYQAVKAGQFVCVALRHGTLGMPWYQIGRCVSGVQRSVDR